jgi:hypothetical protein
MRSDYPRPINLGTEELVTVNQLVDMVAEIAGKRIVKRHDLSKPEGVRGRNSDNSRLRQVLGWEPRIILREGLVPTYHMGSSRRSGPSNEFDLLPENLGTPPLARTRSPYATLASPVLSSSRSAGLL